MLILTRKIGEKILIGDDIVITALDNGSYRKQLKLGIEAPKNTRVFRKEVFEKVIASKSPKI